MSNWGEFNGRTMFKDIVRVKTKGDGQQQQGIITSLWPAWAREHGYQRMERAMAVAVGRNFLTEAG